MGGKDHKLRSRAMMPRSHDVIALVPKQNRCKMVEVGFEPTPLSRPQLECGALDQLGHPTLDLMAKPQVDFFLSRRLHTLS